MPFSGSLPLSLMEKGLKQEWELRDTAELGHSLHQECCPSIMSGNLLSCLLREKVGGVDGSSAVGGGRTEIRWMISIVK